jgi:DNA-damage-inducible protein J
MARTATVRARTDETLKEQAESILNELGITTTELINLLLRQVVLTRSVPFPVRIPNARTRKTFEKTDRGEDLHRYKSADEMFKKLGI